MLNGIPVFEMRKTKTCQNNETGMTSHLLACTTQGYPGQVITFYGPPFSFYEGFIAYCVAPKPIFIESEWQFS